MIYIQYIWNVQNCVPSPVENDHKNMQIDLCCIKRFVLYLIFRSCFIDPGLSEAITQPITSQNWPCLLVVLIQWLTLIQLIICVLLSWIFFDPGKSLSWNSPRTLCVLISWLMEISTHSKYLCWDWYYYYCPVYCFPPFIVFYLEGL